MFVVIMIKIRLFCLGAMRVAGVILTRTQSTVLLACGAYVAADPYLLNFAMGPACNNVDGFSPHLPHRNGCVSHVT